MDAGERRKWRRLEHGLRVQLQILDSAAGASRWVSAIGTHLSPNGLFVQLGDPPVADSRVRISIGGDSDDSVKLEAEGVVINQFVPDDARDQAGVGIKLSETSPAWRKLYDWLSQTS